MDRRRHPEAVGPDGAFVIANSISELSAAFIIDRVKSTTDKGSDNGVDCDSDTLTHRSIEVEVTDDDSSSSKDEENDPANSEGDEVTSGDESDEEASEGSSDVAAQLSSPGHDSDTLEHEGEMSEGEMDEEEMESDPDDESSQSTERPGSSVIIEADRDMGYQDLLSSPAEPMEEDEDMSDGGVPIDEEVSGPIVRRIRKDKYPFPPDPPLIEPVEEEEDVEDDGDHSPFSTTAASDHGDEDMADATCGDEDMEIDDLAGGNVDHSPLFSSPEGSIHGGEATGNVIRVSVEDNTSIGQQTTRETPSDDAMDIDTAGDHVNDHHAAPAASKARLSTEEVEAEAGSEDDDEDDDEVDDDIDNFTGPGKVGSSSTSSQAKKPPQAKKRSQANKPSQAKKPRQAQRRPQNTKGPKSKIDHWSNDLYMPILDKEGSQWPPMGYECKICGFKGAWRARGAHLQGKHADQWTAATGQKVTVYRCPIAGCGHSDTRNNYITRHLKRVHPGVTVTAGKRGEKRGPAKKGKKREEDKEDNDEDDGEEDRE